MKRIDNLFEQLCSFKNLYLAYQKAKKGKRNHGSIKRFNYNLEKNLFKIAEQLKKNNYNFGPYNSFIVEVPKRRKIEAATFRDKIVHYCIHDLLKDFYERKFINTTFACIKNRGNHQAMLKVYGYVNRYSDKYYFQGDIKKYFASINREVLVMLLHKVIADKNFMKLIEQLVLHAPGRQGLPIGNLTSQIFANVYLNELDQFIKRKLKIKNYVRYMDDFVCITNSKEEAIHLKNHVNQFLKESLSLELAPHKIHIGRVKKGLSFVGYKITPGNIRIRGSSLRRFKKRLKSRVGEERSMSLSSFLGHASFCTDYIALKNMLDMV